MSRLDWSSKRPPSDSSTVAVLRHAQKLKASRAPMVNPYDKFTQPEFDVWIGDMTNSLRRALGFEQDEPRLLEKTHVNGTANSGILEYPQLDLSDQDEIPDDSFAQIKKRREKGKARDPREGPGLGRDRTQPIDVISSDEEEEDEVKDLTFSLRDDDPDTYDQNEDSESDYLLEASSPLNDKLSSPPARIGPPLRSRQKNEAEESNAGTDDYHSDEYDDEDGDTVNQASEVISISSDEDESVNDDEDHREFDYYNRPGPSRHPRDGSYEDDEVQGVDGAADEVQPFDDDTSFPPRCSSPRRKLELNDPWEAPRIYAEDYYSGGELSFPAGAHIHPDHLGPLDEDTDAIEEGEELSRPDEVDHNSETSSNLRSVSEFQQNYYEGNAIASWDELDPHFFAHTEDVDIGIDSFLSFGTFAPKQSELRTHLSGTEYPIETGSKQSSQSMSLPALTSVAPSKRYEPIPQGAEVITLDDSDDDGEDSVEVIPPLNAILEMVTEPGTRHPEEPEVAEESQTNYSTPFLPIVENVVGLVDDEELSVHTAHTEDIEHESRLQPFEIVETEVADLKAPQERIPDLGQALSEVNSLDHEERDNPDDVEPEGILLNTVDTLPLDAIPKPITVEVDKLTLSYYEDFDDIYETPVPEILPPDPSGERYLEGVNFLTDILNVDIEVEKSQDSDLAGSPAGVFEQFPWYEKNGGVSKDDVQDSTMEESSLETSRSSPINVDVQNLRRSATPNGLQNAVSPKAEELPKTPEFATKTLTVPLSPSVPGQPRIPMPVMANATVPDPTESPTRLQEHPILSIPGTPDIPVISLKSPRIADEVVLPHPSFPLGPLLHSLNRNADGLFTPADFSTATTPAEDSDVAILPSEWQEADGTTSKTVASDELHAQAELTDKHVVPPPEEVGDILTQTDIISSRRMAVLMTDPYPYCLSTPFVSDPTSDDGSSEEIDDNSKCSHSTEEKENEQVEVQFTFPLVDNIDPHNINCQPATTEFEVFSAPLAEFDLQAMTTGTQNLPKDKIVKELGSSPTLDEKDFLVATELQYPATEVDDSPILAEKDSDEQVTFPTQQTSKAGVDAEGNPEAPLEEKKETDATIPEDSHLQQTYQEDKGEGILQAAEVIPPELRPSKRKRETSPHPDGSDKFSVKSKRKLRAKSKGKQRGKAAEPCIVEQPEHDTIYVRTSPFKHHARDFATSEPPENPASHQISVENGVTDRASKFSKAEVNQPPHPQFHIPSLFHAHGRTKRQKSRIEPIASVRQTRVHEDQPAPKSPTQHTSAFEKNHSQSGPSRNPSPLDETVLPATTAIATEVRQAAQSDARSSAESSPLSSTVATPVPVVEPPIQEVATTFPQPSSIPTYENSKPTHSTTPTTVAFPPTPSLHSSPARFLQPSSSLSSIRSTRSQCKYHKITLPMEENGRRVCFLVPGCSLTNQELMKEENIEDRGEAKYEDSLRMIQNIDHLDFDQYLIGVLRQLVGLDILREGEVFYLPQHGDNIQRKHWPRKSISSTGRGSDYTSFVGSPGYSYSGSARSPSTRPPLSNADSVFTSLSGITTGDDESDNQSPSKGINTSKGDTKVINEESLHEESTPPKSTKQGVKRNRTFDGAIGNDGTRKSKRLRRQSTNPSSNQFQQHD